MTCILGNVHVLPCSGAGEGAPEEWNGAERGAGWYKHTRAVSPVLRIPGGPAHVTPVTGGPFLSNVSSETTFLGVTAGVTRCHRRI